MRHVRSVATLGAILGVSILAACVDVADAPLPVATVYATLNRTSLRMGDTLVITVVGTNTSGQPLEVPNYPCLAKFDVRDSQGAAVIPFGDPIYCILPLYPPRVLAPGDTWGDVVRITHPPAGEFRVRGGLPLRIADGYVYSSELSLTVRP